MKHIGGGGSAPIPRSRGECPDCSGRMRENKADGTLYCEECDWKQKRGEGL